MIKELDVTPVYGYAEEGQYPEGSYGQVGYDYPSSKEMMNKINELVKTVNKLTEEKL